MRWWLIALVVWCWTTAAGAASLPTPVGWEQGAAADEQAHQRADAWATAWGAQVRGVMSTRSPDEFVETLTVLDVGTPMPAEVLAELDVGRPWLEQRVALALGSNASLDPDSVELRPQGAPGVALLLGKFDVGDQVAWVATGPTGARHLAVVMLVPSAEEVLYARVFDDAVEGLDGLLPPIAPFDRGSAQVTAAVLWVLGAGLFAIVWTRRSLPMPGARVAGRQVAGIVVGLAVLVILVAGMTLGDVAVELSLAGSSPWGLAMELGLGGLVMALLIVTVTELWQRRLQPVASAPQVGSFSVAGAGRRRGSARTPYPGVPIVGAEAGPGLGPAITGDTQVGPPPAITGDTQVGPPPAITGDTQVGPPPAITGNTKVGPAPQPELDPSEPPAREIISGDIEVDTQVSPRPLPPRTGGGDGIASLTDEW